MSVDRVEPERGSSAVAERGRQRPDRRATSVDAAVRPDGVGDLAGRYAGSPCAVDPGRQRVGGEAGDARPSSASVMLAMQRRHDADGPTIDGRPRTNASQVIRRPPAGWTSTSAQPLAVADAEAGASNTPRAGAVAGSRRPRPPSTTSRPTGVSTNVPGHGW